MKVFVISILLNLAALIAHAQPLKEALANKDTIKAAELIKAGANVNEPDKNGTTLLMEACHFPNLLVAGFLLRHGATVDAPRSPKGRTALMVATAYWCGVDMVKLLVENGADVNLYSQDGATPLMLAAGLEKLDVVNYLLEHGADPNKKNFAAKTALDLATAGKVEDYMVTSVKDTRFDRDKVIAALKAAMKKLE